MPVPADFTIRVLPIPCKTAPAPNTIASCAIALGETLLNNKDLAGTETAAPTVPAARSVTNSFDRNLPIIVLQIYVFFIYYDQPIHCLP